MFSPLKVQVEALVLPQVTVAVELGNVIDVPLVMVLPLREREVVDGIPWFEFVPDVPGTIILNVNGSDCPPVLLVHIYL